MTNEDQKEQIEFLMNDLLDFAKKMLSNHGEFHPFGGYLEPSGSVVQVGVKSEIDSGDSQKELDSLLHGLKALVREGGPIGFGVATDVLLPFPDGSKGDAIKFFLEHKGGYCAEVFFRYDLSSGNLSFSDVSAQQGDRTFFVD